MSKKPRKPDLFDRIALEVFTPGGGKSRTKPADRLQLMRRISASEEEGLVTGWSQACLADFLRSRLRRYLKK